MGKINCLPCLDSASMAATRRRDLDIPRDAAAALGLSAVEICGGKSTSDRESISLWEQVQAALAARISIPPLADLPDGKRIRVTETNVRVMNETTLGASKQLVERGLRPLALNFANGIHPGGGFLHGARAQEETLCRSSALYLTLLGDPMYVEHKKRPLPDSTSWCILSPDVPVFRADDGTRLTEPWLLSFITCAAPYEPVIGQPRSATLLRERILRVLEVARAYDFTTLLLGAWGCGAFGNDPLHTALDLRLALENEFTGTFSDIVLAITDWSPERKTLGPFRDVFSDG